MKETLVKIFSCNFRSLYIYHEIYTNIENKHKIFIMNQVKQKSAAKDLLLRDNFIHM